MANIRSGIDANEPPIFDLDDRTRSIRALDTPATWCWRVSASRPMSSPTGTASCRRRRSGDRRLPAPLASLGGSGLRRAAGGGAGAGIDLSCTDSYRSIEEQIDLKNASRAVGHARQERPRMGLRGRPQPRLPPEAFGNSVSEWLKTTRPSSGGSSGDRRTSRGIGCTGATRRRCPTAETAAPTPTAATAGRPGGWSTSRSCAACSACLPDADLDAVVAAVVADFNAPTIGRRRCRRTAHEGGAVQPDRSGRPPGVRQGATGDGVRWVQMRVGCVPDGKFGPATERAVREFQRAAGLATTASSAPKTWAALAA